MSNHGIVFRILLAITKKWLQKTSSPKDITCVDDEATVAYTTGERNIRFEIIE